MKKLVQRRMHCPCGRAKMLARGLCATCYSLRRQDDEYFGGLREAVLDRDGRRCRVCDAPGGRKRSLAVHHRVPGRSELVPRQYSTGGKAKLLGISKRGNVYLRKILIHGAWLDKLDARAHKNVVVVAMANKLARVAWAVLSSGNDYRPTAVPA